MSGFKPRRGFQAEVATRLVAPAVRQVAERVAGNAKRFAPGTKTWVTMRDDRVRNTHVEADDQEVPENVRFIVRTPDYDRRTYPHEWQQMVKPGDRKGGTIGNTINCRCVLTHDPNGVAETISAGQVVVAGTRVTCSVVCTHPRAVDAEFGNDVDHGARFMGRAAVAAGL